MLRTNSRNAFHYLRRLTGCLAIACAIAAIFASGAAHSAATPVAVSATILTKNKCTFASAAVPLAFGVLDQSSPIDVVVSTSITFQCKGKDDPGFFSITEDYGLFETAPGMNRMQNTTAPSEFIFYTLALSPASGWVQTKPPVNATLTITGTVKGVDYQDATAGAYTDTVVLTIAP